MNLLIQIARVTRPSWSVVFAFNIFTWLQTFHLVLVLKPPQIQTSTSDPRRKNRLHSHSRTLSSTSLIVERECDTPISLPQVIYFQRSFSCWTRRRIRVLRNRFKVKSPTRPNE